VVGIAGVIGMAQQQGLIPSAHTVFEQLLQSDFRISRDLIEAVLSRIEAP